jgi:hypothetical protein
MKNPELLEDDFKAILKEYNEVKDVKFSFTDSYNDPDVVCSEESSADGYSVWILKEAGEDIHMSDHMYYYEPKISAIFRLMHNMHNDCVEAFIEVGFDYIGEWMYEELCTEFERYEELKLQD